jgi:hypothetical protein
MLIAGKQFVWIARLPFWVLFAGFSLLSAALFWFDRRLRDRLRDRECIACGYDRFGIGPTEVCPECGRAIPDAS